MNLLYALLAGILPTLLWLWFWLREDNLNPEPRSIIAISFILGIAVVPLAIIFEKYASDLIITESYKYILWAGIEEICKFIAVLIIIIKSKNVDEPIDIMIYSITVALGFAALENTLFILSPIQNGDILRGIITGNMRFIGATLVHIVSS
ncbi:MAG: PrsW family glutamic-type intramembrane protease, partial [Patescibacteria group bacterium]